MSVTGTPEKFGPIRVDHTAQRGKIEFTINNVHAVVYAVQVFSLKMNANIKTILHFRCIYISFIQK